MALLSIADKLAAPSVVVKQRETIDEASERLGVDVASLTALLSQLGMRIDELGSVEVTTDGVVVTDKRGVAMLNRVEPDANGAIGWMLLRRPDGLRPTEEQPELPPYTWAIFERPEVVEEPKPKAGKKAPAEDVD